MTEVMAHSSSSEQQQPTSSTSILNKHYHREYFHYTQLGTPQPPVKRSSSSLSFSSKITDENDPESGFGVVKDADGSLPIGPLGVIYFCKELERMEEIPPIPHHIHISTSYTAHTPPIVKRPVLHQSISATNMNKGNDRQSRNLKTSPSVNNNNTGLSNHHPHNSHITNLGGSSGGLHSAASSSAMGATTLRGSRELSSTTLATSLGGVPERAIRQSGRAKTFSPSNRDSVSSPRDGGGGGGGGDKRRTKVKTKRKSDNERLARKEEKRKRAHGPSIIIRSIDDFPEEAVKLLRKTKIPDENFMEHLNVTVHIIRFRTGFNVRTEEEMLKKAKEQHGGDSLLPSSSLF